MAGDHDVAVIDLGSDPRLLRAVDEMVEQDAEATAIARAKASHSLGEVVRSLELFDDDTLDAQVGAPDLLDEFGVVDALDPDSAGAGDSGGNIACVDRPAGGDLRSLGFGPGRHEFAGHALVVDVGSYRPVGVADGVVLAVAVAQHESWGRERHEGADDAGRSIL